VFAISCYGGKRESDLISKLGAAHPIATLSVMRVAGSLVCVLGGVFLFFVSVFLEPPPHEEGRLAVRASMFGLALCLAHNVILAQLVCSIFGLVAELSMATEPVGWLLAFSYASPSALCATTSALAVMFWIRIKDDREWLEWLEPFERANTGAVEMQYLLHLGPFCLAWLDAFVFKDGRMLAHCLPDFWSMSALILFVANIYFALCQSHSLLSGGCYLYPFMKRHKGSIEWVSFLVCCVAVMSALCALFYGFIWVRTYVA